MNYKITIECDGMLQYQHEGDFDVLEIREFPSPVDPYSCEIKLVNKAKQFRAFAFDRYPPVMLTPVDDLDEEDI